MKEQANQEEVLTLNKEVAGSFNKGKYSDKIYSDSMMANFFQISADPIIIFDQIGRIVDVNPAFCSIIKQEKSSLIGKSLYELIPFERHYKLRRQELLLNQKGNAKEVLPFKNTMGFTYFQANTTRDPNTSLNMSIMRDITQKRNIEQDFHVNKYYLHELFSEAIDGIIFFDMKGNVLKANGEAYKVFECSLDELVGKRIIDICGLDPAIYDQSVKEFIHYGALKSQIWIKTPSGKDKLIEFTCKAHSLDGYIITIFRDVTRRSQLANDLEKSERKFRRIFEDSIDGFILWNDEYRIVDINSAAERLIGRDRGKLIGFKIMELFDHLKEKKKTLTNHINQVVKNGKHETCIEIETKEGKLRYFDVSTKREIVEGLHFTVFNEATERVEMQEQLRKSDRLTVIGELAAGIAHEIRNPMTALKGFIKLLESSIKTEHSMYYEVITSELARIDSIINEFLILAKPQAIRFREKDIKQIMKETVDLLYAQAVLYNVQFITKYDNSLPLVYCEPNQLKKVFINLIKNAIEVMPDGGEITITIKGIKNRQILISIQDEGAGIPKERMKNLGEPFFTTKDRGTGLGLMVSYRIISEHNGTIKVESEEGKGTVFHITLPINFETNLQ